MKPLYGVYVFLSPESARAFHVDLYGGERASCAEEALQLFMRRLQVSYVELALTMSVSEQGEMTGGAFHVQVSCDLGPHEAQPHISAHFQEMLDRLLPKE